MSFAGRVHVLLSWPCCGLFKQDTCHTNLQNMATFRATLGKIAYYSVCTVLSVLISNIAENEESYIFPYLSTSLSKSDTVLVPPE